MEVDIHIIVATETTGSIPQRKEFREDLYCHIVLMSLQSTPLRNRKMIFLFLQISFTKNNAEIKTKKKIYRSFTG